MQLGRPGANRIKSKSNQVKSRSKRVDGIELLDDGANHPNDEARLQWSRRNDRPRQTTHLPDEAIDPREWRNVALGEANDGPAEVTIEGSRALQRLEEATHRPDEATLQSQRGDPSTRSRRASAATRRERAGRGSPFSATGRSPRRAGSFCVTQVGAPRRIEGAPRRLERSALHVEEPPLTRSASLAPMGGVRVKRTVGIRAVRGSPRAVHRFALTIDG